MTREELIEATMDKIEKARERRFKLQQVAKGDAPLDYPDFRSLVHGAIKRRIRGETRLIKRHKRAASRDKKRGYAMVPKPHGLAGRMKGCSLAKDAKGYFVHTHRARCSSYPTPHAIPKSKIRFIASTG